MARIVSDMRTCSFLLSGGKLEFVYDFLSDSYFTRKNEKFYALLRKMILAHAVFHMRILANIVENLDNDSEVSEIIENELKKIVKAKDLSELDFTGDTTISKGSLEVRIQNGVIKNIVKKDEYGNEWNIERENKFFLSKLCSELTSLKKTSPMLLEYICKSASNDGILQVMLESLNKKQKALA